MLNVFFDYEKFVQNEVKKFSEEENDELTRSKRIRESSVVDFFLSDVKLLLQYNFLQYATGRHKLVNIPLSII